MGISPDHDLRVKCIHSRILATANQSTRALDMLKEVRCY